MIEKPVKKEAISTEIDPDREYTAVELEEIADALLMQDANTVDSSGKRKGIGGKDPILFESHLKKRRRNEILPREGVPDPAIVSGMYWRVLPEGGRKVNSEQARKESGAGWYK